LKLEIECDFAGVVFGIAEYRRIAMHWLCKQQPLLCYRGINKHSFLWAAVKVLLDCNSKDGVFCVVHVELL
jgi:hypothetical protein